MEIVWNRFTKLVWDPVNTPDVVGYRVRWASSSNQIDYESSGYDAGSSTSIYISDLGISDDYYGPIVVVISAYDSDGSEIDLIEKRFEIEFRVRDTVRPIRRGERANRITYNEIVQAWFLLPDRLKEQFISMSPSQRTAVIRSVLNLPDLPDSEDPESYVHLNGFNLRVM